MAVDAAARAAAATTQTAAAATAVEMSAIIAHIGPLHVRCRLTSFNTPAMLVLGLGLGLTV